MGTLHETNPSLWGGTAPLDELPPSEPLGKVDVAVVGAGITGLSTALALLERGASVAVYEAGQVCSGVTAYTTAKVTSLHGLIYSGLAKNRGNGTAQEYADANEAGLRQVAEWVDSYGIDCEFERRAAYTYTLDEARVGDIEAEVDAAQRAGLGASFVGAADDNDGLPFPIAAAIRVDRQGQFHPRKYCLGLVRAILDRGGAIYEHTRVVDLDQLPQTQHIVLATHLPFLDRGTFFAKTYPERSYAMAVRVSGSRPTGMYLCSDEPRSLRTSGDFLIVGGEGHKVGHEADTRTKYEALERWARKEFDVTSIEHRWSAQDYRSVDGMPFVGRQLPASNVFVATGFGKWGMANGTAAGLMIAELISGSSNELRWPSFDATRLREPLTSRAMLEENVDAVAQHLALDRLKTMSPPPADTLAPGEWAIVELDGDKVAAYRDEDGALHAVSPACTHLGCLIGFNTAERTWDCPCHGSRYALDGSVIQGPSLHDLEVKTTKPST